MLTALQEVQNSLVAYANEQQHRVYLAQVVDLDQRAVELSTKRYNQGLNDFTSVLVAERSLFAAQNALVSSSQDLGTNTVALFKALGGGWNIDELENPERAATQPASATQPAPATEAVIQPTSLPVQEVPVQPAVTQPIVPQPVTTQLPPPAATHFSDPTEFRSPPPSPHH